MFYSDELLSRNGALGHVWLAANMEKKLSRADSLKADISSSVHTIVDDSGVPLALRLSGQLLLGVVRIYSRKAVYLMEDCNEALLKLKMTFRTGNVDMDRTTVTVAKTHSLTLQNRVTDLDLLLLPEPSFDLGLPDFTGGSTSSFSGRRNAQHEESMLISSQYVSSASHRDITLPDRDDTVDIGRGLSSQHELDDLGGQDLDLDLGLNFDDTEGATRDEMDLDLDLDLGDIPTTGAQPQQDDGDQDYGVELGGPDDYYADLLAEGRARRIGDDLTDGEDKESMKSFGDVETGLSAPGQRPEDEDLGLDERISVGGLDDSREHALPEDELGVPSSPRVPGSPGSPDGPPTPTEGADILGDIEVTTDLGADESARRSIIDEEEKEASETADGNALRVIRRRPQGPRHAPVDRFTEIETSNQQIQTNRSVIIRERSLLPRDHTAFTLTSMLNINPSALIASMYVPQRENPALARLVDPDFVHSRMTELREQREAMKRKRSLSDMSEDGSHKTPRTEGSLLGDLDFDLDLTEEEIARRRAEAATGEQQIGDSDQGPVDLPTDQDYDISDFPNARPVTEPVRDLEADRRAYEEQEGADFPTGDDHDGIYTTEPQHDLEGGLGLDLDLDFGTEGDKTAVQAEEEEVYGAAGPSGVSQYTINASKMLKEGLERRGYPAPAEGEALSPPEAVRPGAVYFNQLVDENATRGTRVKMFFEMLVLATKDAVKLEQPVAFGDITIRPKNYLYDGIWEGRTNATSGEQPTDTTAAAQELGDDVIPI